MEYYVKMVKTKYKLSKKYYKDNINKKYNKNKTDQYLYYYDLLNPYPLFPTIIDINISKYAIIINTDLDNILNLENVENEESSNMYSNLSSNISFNKKIGNKIKFFEELVKGKENSKVPRQLYSYELKDELILNYNAEYATVAWLKCYEILEYYKFLDDIPTNTIKYFGICEQPGAFIYAINHYVKQKLNKQFDFVLQSLNHVMDSNAFKPEINLHKQYQNKYDYGSDATGDITNLENIKYYRQKYYDSHFDIITADCGINCSSDYGEQEKNSLNLVLSQVILALSLANKNTNFFFKLFTISEELTKEIIYMLSYFFTTIQICRTITTKPASGEIYCVCTNFKYEKLVMDKKIDFVYKWYEKYTVNKNIRLINNDIIGECFYNNINKVNEMLSYRRLLSLNFLYFRLNNSDFTLDNKEVHDRINNVVKQTVEYFIKLYKIKKLDDKNKLVNNKFKVNY